jgi:malonyl CoA-acyl carrier protein transacylase
MVAASALDVTGAARLLRLRGLAMKEATRAVSVESQSISFGGATRAGPAIRFYLFPFDEGVLLQSAQPFEMQALLTGGLRAAVSQQPIAGASNHDAAGGTGGDAWAAAVHQIRREIELPARAACDAAMISERAPGLPESIASIAAVNAPSQIVLAGDARAVEAAASALKASKFARRAVPLAVSCPFHCGIMAPAAQVLGPVLFGHLHSRYGAAFSIPEVGDDAAQGNSHLPLDRQIERALGSLFGRRIREPDVQATEREMRRLIEQLLHAAAAAPASDAHGPAHSKQATGSAVEQPAREGARLSVPIIMNADALQQRDMAAAARALVTGVTMPVQWYASVLTTLAAHAVPPHAVPEDDCAAHTAAQLTFLELGAGSTLSAFVRQIVAQHRPLLTTLAQQRRHPRGTVQTAPAGDTGVGAAEPAIDIRAVGTVAEVSATALCLKSASA